MVVSVSATLVDCCSFVTPPVDEMLCRGGANAAPREAIANVNAANANLAILISCPKGCLQYYEIDFMQFSYGTWYGILQHFPSECSV